jgi:lipopolysaccharide export system protein LptC
MSAAATPPPELHLPDLPEVAVQLGGASAPEPGQALRSAQPWPYRVRQAVSAYLPLLLMAVLAAGTWWLVKNTPQAPGPTPPRPPSQAPDYTMSGFSVTRFGPDGRVVIRIDGDQLRHFPDTDRLEIDGVRIVATGPDGRSTRATARQALAKGDASEVQLLGGAHVVSQLQGQDTLDIRSEFLHAFVRFEQLRSHLPVQVRYGNSNIRAAGLDYDHAQGRLQLNGPVRLQLQPPGRPQP